MTSAYSLIKPEMDQQALEDSQIEHWHPMFLEGFCLRADRKKGHGSQSETCLMGVTEKMWDAVARVIRMDDKVEHLAGTIKAQQTRIENLTGRVIRLETALEIALAAQGVKDSTRRITGE